MTEYVIKRRDTGVLLYTGGGKSLRDVVEAAVLDGANLAGANLTRAKLLSKRPIIQVGPIGSRCAYLVAYLTDAGVRVRAGCFSGSLERFRAAVAETHGESVHGREYAAAIAMIEAHAECWTPAREVTHD